MSGEALKNAVKRGNLSEVQRLVGGNKSIVNWKDESGYTVFYWACRDGHLEIARFLVENGANPLLKSDSGNTAFHVVAYINRPSMVRFLISLKLNPFEKLKRGETPREWAVEKSEDEEEDYTIVISLLEEYEAEFEEKYGRDTGLNCQDWEEYKRIFSAIFVDNLPFHKTEDDIAAFFAQAGCPVKSLALFLPTDRTEQVQNLGAGYVTLESFEHAERAVDTLNGRVMEEEERKEESGGEERPLFVCWKSEHEDRQEDAKRRADEHNRRLFLQLRELADQLAAENGRLREALQLQQLEHEEALLEQKLDFQNKILAMQEQYARVHDEIEEAKESVEQRIEFLKTELMTKMMSGQLPPEELIPFNQQLAALQINPSSDDLQAIKKQLQEIFDRVST